MIYILLYMMAVIWVVAGLLYADNYMIHSKSEVLFAPLLLVFTTTQLVLRWGYKLYQRRTGPYMFSR